MIFTGFRIARPDLPVDHLHFGACLLEGDTGFEAPGYQAKTVIPIRPPRLPVGQRRGRCPKLGLRRWETEVLRHHAGNPKVDSAEIHGPADDVR
jgi:hypothetical protein